jgi:pyruvate/2-oxoglutarate dehydrogenase complex dihydrolipoamide dehydrogenase (E3) component
VQRRRHSTADRELGTADRERRIANRELQTSVSTVGRKCVPIASASGRQGREMSNSYDVIVIGTGQAGPYVAHRMAKSGMKVAVIERGLFGGTCVNTGCIPTKTMVASAYAANLARRGGEFGVDVADVRIDLKRVVARKDAISGESRAGVENGLRQLQNCTVYQGHARFVAAHEIAVGAERLTGERIFINVGGRAAVPEMPGIHDVPFLTNSSIMRLESPPEHLVIAGGSYVGLEFGQMFRRFGSDVTIVEMGPRLIGREDEDVSAAVRDILEREGVNVRVNATCVGFERRGADIITKVECTSGAPHVSGSHVLLAVGRHPNTHDLGLEHAGIAVDHKGYIVVDDELRTSVPGVWALGDCNGQGAFTHTAFNDAEIVVGNLLENDRRRVSDRIPAYGLFIDPPLGRAGLTEIEARKRSRRVLVGTRPMTKVKRAVEKGESQGFMKVLVDADTERILGAAVLGPGGDEAVHALLDAMYARASYKVVQRAMHIHPTVSELVPTMLGELRELAPDRAGD